MMTTFCCLRSWESGETSSIFCLLLKYYLRKKLLAVSIQVLLMEDFCPALLSVSSILDLQGSSLRFSIPNQTAGCKLNKANAIYSSNKSPRLLSSPLRSTGYKTQIRVNLNMNRAILSDMGSNTAMQLKCSSEATHSLAADLLLTATLFWVSSPGYFYFSERDEAKSNRISFATGMLSSPATSLGTVMRLHFQESAAP